MKTSIALVSLLALAAPLGARQAPPSQSKAPVVTVAIELQIGGAAFASKGTGECNYAAKASIYDAPGAMWAVRRNDGNDYVNFTLWKLAKGGDMLTLDVTRGGKRHRVNTLQVGPASDRQGIGQGDVRAGRRGGRVHARSRGRLGRQNCREVHVLGVHETGRQRTELTS